MSRPVHTRAGTDGCATGAGPRSRLPPDAIKRFRNHVTAPMTCPAVRQRPSHLPFPRNAPVFPREAICMRAKQRRMSEARGIDA